jgi:hypothetical protein
MPKELKPLVNACVWILFIYGCVMLINTIVQSAIYGLREEMTMVGGGIAMVSFILTAVAAWLRYKMG